MELGEKECGFRKLISCTGGFSNVQQRREKINEKKSVGYSSYMDLMKTYARLDAYNFFLSTENMWKRVIVFRWYGEF